VAIVGSIGTVPLLMVVVLHWFLFGLLLGR